MFDIGFAELLLIGVVGLLVLGPERLPGAVRTVSLWLGRFRRSFNQIKREIEQDMHNDAVMSELRKAGEQLQDDAQSIKSEVAAIGQEAASDMNSIAGGVTTPAPAADTPAPAEPIAPDTAAGTSDTKTES